MSTWQPIETAPKDGTKILLAVPPNERWDAFIFKTVLYNASVGEGLWYNEEWRWANDSCECCWGRIYPTPPTHWMPLPEPPK